MMTETAAPTENSATTWLTVADAANRIKASRASIYRAIRNGELKAAVVNSRGDMRIHDSWIDQWLLARLRTGSR
jgi:excisionase family DNA binding protein